MIYNKEPNKIILVNKDDKGNYKIKVYKQKEFDFNNKQGELEFKSNNGNRGLMFP